MMTQIVSDNDDDIRLDRWFKRHYPGLPHAMLEKYLRKGDIRVEGKKAKSSDRVKAGQELRYPTLDAVMQQVRERPLISAKDAAFVQSLVLYKDARVLVINKPSGLPVQGGSKIRKSLDDLLDGLQFDAPERPKLVHRLDRDTSGVLVLARSSKVAAALAKAFAAKDMEKTYWALVHGTPASGRGVIDYRLLKAARGEASYERVAVDDEEGKFAKTEYRVVESLVRRFAFMELKPLTGRTHQLRVHMQAIGCPIVGDEKYGGDTGEGREAGVTSPLHLHARKLIIPAVAGGKQLEVVAPLPEHMLESFKALGIHVPKS